MKKESIELRRAEVVSKEAEAQREKNLYDEHKYQIKHITYLIKEAIIDGQSYIELEIYELNKYLIKHLETMGYIVVYMEECKYYIVAFDKKTAKKFKDYNDEYCFKDKGIRVLGAVIFVFMWLGYMFCQIPVEIKLFSAPLVIWSSISLIKVMRKGAKYRK